MNVFVALLVIGVAAAVLVGLAVLVVLIIRDTARGRGRWGINLKAVSCKECRTPMPMVRLPANLSQAFWGGWTCPECGLELDKWGEPVDEQPFPAKWSAPPDRDPRADDRRHPPRDDYHRRGDIRD